MVFLFTWERREWREAYLLSSQKKADGSGPAVMGYLVSGVMLAGGMGDVLHSLWHSRGAILHDRFSLALLFLGVSTLFAWSALTLLSRRRRFRDLPEMPRGEQQAIFHELGWNVSATEQGRAAQTVRSWSEFHERRAGRTVLAFITSDGGLAGIPLRALTADQNGWLEQIMERKRRPLP